MKTYTAVVAAVSRAGEDHVGQITVHAHDLPAAWVLADHLVARQAEAFGYRLPRAVTVREEVK